MKLVNKLLDRNATLVNYLIMLVGVILILSSVIIGTGKIWGQICISVGTSLLASAIVVFLSSRYLFKQNRIKEIVDKWGITGIFRTRSEMNAFANIDLGKNEKKLDIIAFGLRRFRQTNDDLIISKIKRGMKIRVITIHPYSKFLIEREKAEEGITGEISNTILQLDLWIKKLQDHQIKENQVEIKYYDSLPLDFYFGLDDSIYMGPYLYGYDSQQTISFSFKSDSEGYDYYSTYFEKLWVNTKLCNKMEVQNGLQVS